MFAETTAGHAGYILPGAAVAFGWLCPDKDPRIVGLAALSLPGWKRNSDQFGELIQLSFDKIGELDVSMAFCMHTLVLLLTLPIQHDKIVSVA